MGLSDLIAGGMDATAATELLLNVVWTIVGATLVYFMQAGFAMCEAGFTRAKNTGNILMKNMMDFVLGSLFLALIALIPNLVRSTDVGSQLTLLSGIGGTSILIVVGVVLDTMRQIKAITVTKSYDQYK